MHSIMSRIEYAKKNIIFGYIGTIVSLVLSFVSRTLFIGSIGIDYLGINSLFVNVLQVLSFAELGVGVAINYSLYKPVADNDIEKIKSLMMLYKRAYRWIAFVVGLMGLILMPFLRYIINDPGQISHHEIIVYYLMFLLNTVISYLLSYKYSLPVVMQKGYVLTNINTVATLLIYSVQIVVVLCFRRYLVYLLSNFFLQLIQKLYTDYYLNKNYPILTLKHTNPLSSEEKKPIINNIKALVYHKVGDIAVHQTDNILISAFINVSTVGIVSNYNLLIVSVSQFIHLIFNSVVSGLGNLIATENKEKQYEIFCVYRFLAFWLYGFASIAFLILLTPFIKLWIGEKMTIDQSVLILIIVNYYFMGHRIVVNNFKTAAGFFEADKHISIIQAVINLIISIYLVEKIGLGGIYVGTVAQGLVSTFIRPVLVYKKVLFIDPRTYYIDSIIYIIVLIIPAVLLEYIKNRILNADNIITFLLLAILTFVITNSFIFVTMRKREEFIYLKNIMFSTTRKKK